MADRPGSVGTFQDKLWLVQSAVPASLSKPSTVCQCLPRQTHANLAAGDGWPNFLTLGLCALPIFKTIHTDLAAAMNTSPASVVGILDRLSTGISRTSIRHYAAPRLKKKKHHLTGFTPGHGERIFVYNHTETGMIVYSHEPELKV